MNSHQLWIFLYTFEVTAFITAANLLLAKASAMTYCPRNQTAELGKLTTISCSFPPSFYAVYWYAGITPEESPFMTYFHHSDEKRRTDFLNNTFDVSRNGSLVILEVHAEHEGTYTVIMYKDPDFFEINTVSLKVVAYPANGSPRIECGNCQQNYYHVDEETNTLTCYSDRSRPPVQLEWIQLSPNRTLIREEAISNIIDNKDGTFNSTTTISFRRRDCNKITELVCTASWDSKKRIGQVKMLLDFTHRQSFVNLTYKKIYGEVNKKYVLPCWESGKGYKVWKQIFSSHEPNTLGFSTGNVTRKTAKFDGVEISADGGLVFASMQIFHEGRYACLFGNEEKEEIMAENLVVLVPPFPPLIQIKGCNTTDMEHCALKQEDTDQIQCAVYGAHPDNVVLQWIATTPKYVYLAAPNFSVIERGETVDVVVETRFTIDVNVPCGEELFIECLLYGTVADILKPKRSVQIIPESCKMWPISRNTVMTFVAIIVVVICITAFIICRIKRGSRRKNDLQGKIEGKSKKMQEVTKKESQEIEGTPATNWQYGHLMCII